MGAGVMKSFEIWEEGAAEKIIAMGLSVANILEVIRIPISQF